MKISMQLYSYDNHLITNLDVDPSMIKYLEKHRSFRIPLRQPYNASASFSVIGIKVHDICIDGQRYYNQYNYRHVWCLKISNKVDSNRIADIISLPYIFDNFIQSISNVCWVTV